METLEKHIQNIKDHFDNIDASYRGQIIGLNIYIDKLNNTIIELQKELNQSKCKHKWIGKSESQQCYKCGKYD